MVGHQQHRPRGQRLALHHQFNAADVQHAARPGLHLQTTFMRRQLVEMPANGDKARNNVPEGPRQPVANPQQSHRRVRVFKLSTSLCSDASSRFISQLAAHHCPAHTHR